MDDTKSIEQINNSIVMPAVNSEEAIDAWKKYQDLKLKILDKEKDLQLINDKEFPKKSYWRKVATFFNLSTEVVKEDKEVIGKTFVWHFTIKAIAPNGRCAIGTGSCDAFEKATLRDGEYYSKGEVLEWGKTRSGKSYPLSWNWVRATANSIHNIRTTAETRATNRAISNLVGGGEVSAEEIITGDEVDTEELSNQQSSATAEKQPRNSKKISDSTKCKFCGTTGKFHKTGCPNNPNKNM